MFQCVNNLNENKHRNKHRNKHEYKTEAPMNYFLKIKRIKKEIKHSLTHPTLHRTYLAPYFRNPNLHLSNVQLVYHDDDGNCVFCVLCFYGGGSPYEVITTE